MPSTGRLRYLDVPAKPIADSGSRGRAVGTLVLIHGFPLSARMWEPQLTLSSHGWRIIAPQLRGFDGGPAEPPAASMDDYAGDNACFQYRHVHTTSGWRWRQVWVCN